MGKEGAIQKTSGPCCSPIVLVRKKDGTIYFCVNYHKLNDATHKDTYPIPRIDDILEALWWANYFCSINLASGYWQIKVVEKDREKTAFDPLLGFYEFLCMPFGLTGAPATFFRLMGKVLVSEEGIAIDPKKVDKICNLSAPKDKGGVRSLIGTLHQELLCNYSPSTGTLKEVSPFKVDWQAGRSF